MALRLLTFLSGLMVVRPVCPARGDIRVDRIFLAGRVAHDFTAFANALVRLDMRAGRHFLQEDLDWFCAGLAFEGQETGWLGWHGAENKNTVNADDKP